MAQYDVEVGPIQNDAAPFSEDMVQGSLPPAPRLFSIRHSLGLTIQDPSFGPVAPFSEEMIQGSVPPQPRLWLPLRTGTVDYTATLVDLAAPFSEDMVQGSMPSRGLPFHAQPVGWLDNTALLTIVLQMTPDMFGGSHPDSPRLFSIRHSLGTQDASATFVNTAAAFTPDMVQGSLPSRGVTFARINSGWFDQTAELNPLVIMTPEMWAGSLPPTPRLFLAPKIGLPLFQSVQTSAPFGEEMVQGAHADQNRAFIAPKAGRVDTQLTFVVQMTPEMWAGNLPSSPRLFNIRHILGVQNNTATFVNLAMPFSAEMVQGQHADRARPFIPLQAGAFTDAGLYINPPIVVISYTQIERMMVMFQPVVILTVEI